MPFRLFDLPDELVVAIIETLHNDKKTLRSLARSSKRLQDLSEPILYRDVFLRTEISALNVAYVLGQRPQRHKAMQKLEARLKGPIKEGLDPFWDLLRKCTHLREFVVESPYCNSGLWEHSSGWDEHMLRLFQIFEEAAGETVPPAMSSKPLQSLTKATLHLSADGYEFWTVRREYASVFVHPTLTDLTLSSINVLDDALEMLIDKASTTPLKVLRLDECNLTFAGLKAVLCTPRALEHLYIGEDRYALIDHEKRVRRSHCNSLCLRQPRKFFEALALQRNTLQSLHYAPRPHWKVFRYDDIGPALSVFPALTRLKLEGHCEPMNNILLSDITAPPNLKQLNVFEDHFGNSLLEWEPASGTAASWIESALSAMPKIKRLELVFDKAEPGYFDFYRQLELTGPILRRRSVELLGLMKPARGRIIPPILYGEELEADRLIYVNDERNFVVRFPLEEPITYSDSEWEDTEDDDDEDAEEVDDQSNEGNEEDPEYDEDADSDLGSDEDDEEGVEVTG